MRIPTYIGIVLTIVVTACATTRTHRLHGDWTQTGTSTHAGVDSPVRQHWTFRSDSTATWIFAGPARSDTFRLRYALEDSLSPAALMVSGFESGPLAGRVLACIYEVRGDVLRLDCEPARRVTEARPALPRTFTTQTVQYGRSR